MSRYDGLIIPRSYSEYINKTDAATLQQALQLSGVLSGAVAAGDNKAVKSSAVNTALSEYARIIKFSLGTIKGYSFECTPLHLYRITLTHPSIANKKGVYIVVIQTSGTYKIDNLLNVNNYTLKMSGLTLTIKSDTDYGLGFIEDLGACV